MMIPTDGATGAKKVIFALDVPGKTEALPLIEKLAKVVGYFKIGLELMSGPDGAFLARAIVEAGGRVFLDLKAHDIPNTVEGAAANAGRLGVHLLTIHALGSAAMMRAAVKGAASTNAETKILAITILTSHTVADLYAVGLITQEQFENCQAGNVSAAEVMRWSAERLARLAKQAGCHGIVCSPEETSRMRQILGPEMLIVNPGIRKAGAEIQDQARVGTAGQAMQDGASLVVIGRPLRNAMDPAAEARSFGAEIEAVLGT